MKNNKHYAYNSPFKMEDLEGNEYVLTVEQEDYLEDPREWDNLCTMICWHNRYNLGDAHSFRDEWVFLQDLCEHLLGMDYEDCEDITEKGLFKMLVDSNEILIKPINMYEHSGITVSTSSGYPYNDRWDSGCVGFIYVTKETIFKEGCRLLVKDENGNPVLIEHKHENMPSTYSYKTIPITEDTWKDCADKYLESEMKTYDEYLRGEVYQFSLTKKVIVQDKCPHCGEVIREYEDEEEIDSCCGFYGDCLEENGILDNIGNDIKFVEV